MGALIVKKYPRLPGQRAPVCVLSCRYGNPTHYNNCVVERDWGLVLVQRMREVVILWTVSSRPPTDTPILLRVSGSPVGPTLKSASQATPSLSCGPLVGVDVLPLACGWNILSFPNSRTTTRPPDIVAAGEIVLTRCSPVKCLDFQSSWTNQTVFNSL